MKKDKLFYATNRKHIGEDRWNPKGYGSKFSQDGHENLRFGEIEIEYDVPTVNSNLKKDFGNGRIGDGESLSSYLADRSKSAKIIAYKDAAIDNKSRLDSNKETSALFFSKLKELMMRSVDVLIYIHGYNVSWDEAVGSASSLQFMLNSHNKLGENKTQVVLFSWPSNGSMLPFAAYKSDRSDARDSGKSIGRAFLKLRDFLASLHANARNNNEKLCSNKINLLCHSMGNYVLQNALNSKVIGYNKGQILPRIFDNIFLCAADVTDDVLEKGNSMARLHEMASFVTVYYNRGDVAMNISKYTKNMTDRLGQVGNGHPALVHNKVHQVDCSPIVKGTVEHSYYLWASVNKDIYLNLKGEKFDSSARNRKALGQNREWEMI